MKDFNEELKRATYEPSKQLIRILEENYEELTIDQKIDLEKLKVGLKIWELEQQKKEQQGGFRWA